MAGERDEQLAAFIVDSAWLDKAHLIASPTLSELSLPTLSDEEILTVRGRRLTFPEIEEISKEKLSYDAGTLLSGIIAGDWADPEKGLVQVYYAHIRQRDLKGKTVFTMRIEDARLLLHRCAKVLEIGEEELKEAMTRYTTKALYGQEMFSLHEKGIIFALLQSLR